MPHLFRNVVTAAAPLRAAGYVAAVLAAADEVRHDRVIISLDAMRSVRESFPALDAPREYALEERAAEDAKFSELQANEAPVSAAIPRGEWHGVARTLARLERAGDKGLGDIVQRIAAKAGGESFKVWFKRLTGRDCRCDDRRASLNDIFPFEHTWDINGAGIGDAIVLAWIAEGLKAKGQRVRFTRGRTDKTRVLEMLGQEMTDAPGIDLNANGGFTDWANKPSQRADRRPRAVLWQKRLGVNVQPVRPTFAIPAEATEWAERAKAERGGRPLLVCFPFAAWKLRSWPAERWREVLRRAEADGWATLAIHSSDTPELRMMPHWAYGFDLAKIVALCKTASLVLGNDSGGPHLAGTLGTPTVAVVGPIAPVTIFGQMPSVKCVTPSRERVPCVGCNFDHKAGFGGACDAGCKAMLAATVDEVYAEVRTVGATMPLVAPPSILFTISPALIAPSIAPALPSTTQSPSPETPALSRSLG